MVVAIIADLLFCWLICDFLRVFYEKVPTICLTTQAKDMETPLFYEEDGYDVAYNEVKRG